MNAVKSSEDPIMELRFPARPDRMATVRRSVRGAVADCGFDDFAVQEIVLAIGEACQNVMLHGYAGPGAGDIVVRLSWTGEGLVVRVTDFAPTVDPARIRSRDLADIRSGGLGVHFITELMDSVEFQPGPDGVGNTLMMTRKPGDSP